jgi:hypothetical protein
MRHRHSTMSSLKSPVASAGSRAPPCISNSAQGQGAASPPWQLAASSFCPDKSCAWEKGKTQAGCRMPRTVGPAAGRACPAFGGAGAELALHVGRDGGITRDVGRHAAVTGAAAGARGLDASLGLRRLACLVLSPLRGVWHPDCRLPEADCGDQRLSICIRLLDLHALRRLESPAVDADGDSLGACRCTALQPGGEVWQRESVAPALPTAQGLRLTKDRTGVPYTRPGRICSYLNRIGTAVSVRLRRAVGEKGCKAPLALLERSPALGKATTRHQGRNLDGH